MIKVLVSGSGKMGREVLAAVAAQTDMEPVGCVDGLTHENYISVPGCELIPFGSDPAVMIKRVRPDVIVDFTTADWTPKIAKAALEAGVKLVIGTTGQSDSFKRELEADCAKRSLGAIVAPNFALGAILMQEMARMAARYYEHAEIIEMHGEKKIDAPSGTSIATAAAMAEGRAEGFTIPPTEKQTLKGTRGGESHGITIHSVRLPGLVAHQQVIFGATGETLTIRHDTVDRVSFMPGVMLAVREVMKLDKLVVGLDRLIAQ